MSISVSGQSPATFEIKSATLPLLMLRLKSTDLHAFGQELQAYYGDMADFFDNDPVVIDLTEVASDDAPIDFEQLNSLLRARRLHPLVARAGSQAQMTGAEAAGLPPARDLIDRPDSRNAAEAAPAEVPPPGALVIDAPLRSGQQIYARGRDLVLRAMVNPGAEVIADGHIHVYAPLRGRAIAGARGWAEARIFALDMEPELVSIAGVYRTSEEPLPDSVWRHSAVVSLESAGDRDQLVFEPLSDR